MSPGLCAGGLGVVGWCAALATVVERLVVHIATIYLLPSPTSMLLRISGGDSQQRKSQGVASRVRDNCGVEMIVEGQLSYSGKGTILASQGGRGGQSIAHIPSWESERGRGASTGSP